MAADLDPAKTVQAVVEVAARLKLVGMFDM
jgi:hypothetical protein